MSVWRHTHTHRHTDTHRQTFCGSLWESLSLCPLQRPGADSVPESIRGLWSVRPLHLGLHGSWEPKDPLCRGNPRRRGCLLCAPRRAGETPGWASGGAETAPPRRWNSERGLVLMLGLSPRLWAVERLRGRGLQTHCTHHTHTPHACL